MRDTCKRVARLSGRKPFNQVEMYMGVSSLIIPTEETDRAIVSGAGQSEEVIEVLDPKDLLRNAAMVGFSPAVVKQSVLNNRIAGSPWGNIDTNKEFLGVDPEKLNKQRCYLIMLVLDDSGSMEGHESSVVEAAKEFIKEYSDARKSENIHSDVLVAVGRLNDGLIVPYTDVRHFVPGDLASYKAVGQTPLYDVANSALSLQMAKTTELALNGITSKTLTVLMTDGRDWGSRLDAASLKTVISGLGNDGTGNHLIAGIYIGNAAAGVFESIGLKKEWILACPKDAVNLIDTFSRLSKLSMASFARPGDADSAKGPTRLS